jgi:hypothetical protein
MAGATEDEGKKNTTLKDSINTLTPLLVPALVGAIAALGSAYLTGAFGVAKESATQRGTLALEQQKFSYELIRNALNKSDDAAKAATRFLPISV